MTIKPKFKVNAHKPVKLTVQVSSNVSQLVNDYLQFYNEVSREDISIDALISEILAASISSDKAFVKWSRERHNNSAELDGTDTTKV